MTTNCFTRPATDPQFFRLRRLLSERDVAVHGVTNVDGLIASLKAQGADTRFVSALMDQIEALPLSEAAVAAPKGVKVNNYAAKCVTCGGWVVEHTGRIQPKASGKGWDTFHLDGQCPTPNVAFEAVTAVVPAGRYAIREGGVIKFYAVDHGKVGTKWEGRIFVSVQASNDFYPVRDRAAREAVLTAIALDPTAATILYGQALGQCGFCFKALTRRYSADLGYGPTCADKHGLHFDHAAYAASAKVNDAEGE